MKKRILLILVLLIGISSWPISYVFATSLGEELVVDGDCTDTANWAIDTINFATWYSSRGEFNVGVGVSPFDTGIETGGVYDDEVFDYWTMSPSTGQLGQEAVLTGLDAEIDSGSLILDAGAYMYCNGVPAILGIRFYDGAGSLIAEGPYEAVGYWDDSLWHYQSVSINVPTSARKVKVLLICDSEGGGGVYFDGVSAVLKTNPVLLSGVSPTFLDTGTTINATSNLDGTLYLVPKAFYGTQGNLDAVDTADKRTVAYTAGIAGSLSTVGLSSGTYQVYAVDTNGNVSQPSVDITINSVALGPPDTPTAAAGPYISSAEKTAGVEVVVPFGSSGAAENSMVELLIGGIPLPTPLTNTLTSGDITTGYCTLTIPSDAGGEWAYDGAKAITARITDAVGNVGTANATPLTLTIDTTIPNAPTALANSLGTISAAEKAAGVPLVVYFNAYGLVAGDSVELFINGISFANRVIHTLTAAELSAGNCTLTISSDAGGDWAFDGINKPITAKIIDIAGNIGPPNATPLNVTLDTIPPATPSVPDMTAATDAGASNTDNITRNTRPSFTGTTDPSIAVRLYSSGTQIGSGASNTSGVWTIMLSSPLVDGTYTVTARATDAAGNIAESGGLTFTIDTIAPSGYNATLDQPYINQTNRTAVSFTITDAEIGTTYSYFVDSLSSSGLASSATQPVTGIDLSTLADGNYALLVQLQDAAGNVGSQIVINFTKDTVAPDPPYTITATAGPDINSAEKTAGVAVFIQFSCGGATGAEAGDLVELLIEGVPFGTPVTHAIDATDYSTGSCTIIIPSGAGGGWATDGSKSMTARITDQYDNVGTASTTTLTLNLDTAAPSGYNVTIDQAAINNANQTAMSFTFSGAEIGTTYNYTISSSGGGTNVNGSGTIAATAQQITGINTSGLNAGMLTLSVTLTDTTGNTGNLATDTATKDIIAPVGYSVTIDQVYINNANQTTMSFIISGAEIGTIYNYTLSSSGGGINATGSGAITGAAQQITGINTSGLNDGMLTLSVTLTDTAGNTGSVATDTVTKDIISPVGYSVAIDQTIINNANQTAMSFNFSGAEIGTTYNYTISSSGGGTNVNGSGTIAATAQQITGINTSGLNDGMLTLSVTLTDTAGNTGAAATDTVNKDTIAPSGYSVNINQTYINNANQIAMSFTFAGAEVGSIYDYAVSDGITAVSGSGNITGVTQQITGVNISGLSDSILTLSVTLKDIAGNTGTAVTDTVDKDVGVPGGYNVAIDQAFINNANQTAMSFTFNGAETGTTYNYTVSSSGGETNVNGSGTITDPVQQIIAINTSGLNDGTLTLSVTLTDSAGNTGAATADTVNKDVGAPGGYSVTIDQAYINNANQTAMSFTLAGAEVGTTYNFTVSDGVTSVAGNGNITGVTQQVTGINVSGLSDGLLTLSMTLTDMMGNTGTAATDTVTKDIVTPVGYSVAIDQTNINSANQTAISFTFAGAETGTTYNYMVSDGVTTVSGNGNITGATQQVTGINVSGLSDDLLVLSVTLIDAAGNIGVAATDTVNKEATVPTIIATLLAEDNSYIDLTLSKGIYGADDGLTPLAVNDLVLIFTGNGGTATNTVISSVKKNDNITEGLASVLTGGETVIRIFLNITGFPSGVETIEIKPVDGSSIYDWAGNGMAVVQSTGVKMLNGGNAAYIMADQQMTETNLNERTITLTLSGVNFTDNTLSLSSFTLINNPPGLTIKSVTYLNGTHCQLYLAFDGTYFSSNITNLGLNIAGTELTSGETLTASNTLSIIADVAVGKQTVNLRPNESEFLIQKTAVNYQHALNTYWNSDSLVLGKGVSGQYSDCWLYYPALTGWNPGQIPPYVAVCRAELVLKVKNVTGYKTKPRQIKIYAVTDPDHLGTPYFGIYDGIRTGLDFLYRDHRPGRNIPWRNNAANIEELFNGIQPLDIFEFIPQVYEDNGYGLIRLDVKAALSSWLKGSPNQGFYITVDGDQEAGEQIEFYGSTATNADDRPYLRVTYATSGNTAIPAAITGLAAVPGNQQLTLSWDIPTGAAGFRVIRRVGMVPSSPEDGLLIYDGPAGTWFDNKDLENGKTYYYSVFSYDSSRNYSPKVWIKAVPGIYNTPPTAPSGLGYSASGTTVNFTWNDNSNNETGFVVERRIPGGGWIEIVTLPLNQTVFLDSSLQPGSNYEYRIKAVNPTGSSAYAGPVAVTTLNQPVAPANLIWRALSASQVRLSWTDSSDETGYRIELYDENGNPLPGRTPVLLPQGATEYAVTKLAPNIGYRFRVVAVNADGEAFVETELVKTEPDPKTGYL